MVCYLNWHAGRVEKGGRRGEREEGEREAGERGEGEREEGGEGGTWHQNELLGLNVLDLTTLRHNKLLPWYNFSIQYCSNF